MPLIIGFCLNFLGTFPQLSLQQAFDFSPSLQHQNWGGGVGQSTGRWFQLPPVLYSLQHLGCSVCFCTSPHRAWAQGSAAQRLVWALPDVPVAIPRVPHVFSHVALTRRYMEYVLLPLFSSWGKCVWKIKLFHTPQPEGGGRRGGVLSVEPSASEVPYIPFNTR